MPTNRLNKPAKQTRLTKTPGDSGELSPDVLYSVKRAGEILRWGPHSFRRARLAGLNVQYYGRSSFILGSELIRFLGENSQQSRSMPPRRTR